MSQGNNAATEPKGQRLTQPQQQLAALQGYLAKPNFLDGVRQALPQNTISVDHLVRSALSVCKKNPKLMQCTPCSIMEGVVQVAELGLELSTVLGHAYLVPYWNSRLGANEAVLQIGYKGFMSLSYRSPLVRDVSAKVVRKGDEYRCNYGSHPNVTHSPGNDRDLTDNGITHAYAIINLERGQLIESMSIAELLAHRDRYAKKDRNGHFSDAWVDSLPAMLMKTCIRKVCKFSPMEVLTRAATIDEYGERGLQHLIATGIEQTTQEKLAGLRERISTRDEPPEGDDGYDAPGIRPEQASEIAHLIKDKLNWEPPQASGFLAEWGVLDVPELTQDQAVEVIADLKKAVDKQSESK